MKLVLPALMFFWLPTFAQTSQNTQEDAADFTVVMNPKTYGYVNGVRLDSLDAVYGEFSRYSVGRIYFDFGQVWNKRKEMTVTDKNGKPLVFLTSTNSIFLNFFYFNGWQLDKAISVTDGSSLILKKRQ
jgi:hypothetical protein